ncbi:MAG: hypothetical protein HG423_010520 [Propionibacterium sp.]|jgi:hypothetical protein|nr:hypothetical protein [Propionibacterium sp.]
MFLPIPPGGTETPRTLTATEVLVKIAIPTFPLVSLIPAAVAIAVTEVIALPKVIALPEVITATVEPACVTAPRCIPVVTSTVAGAGAAPSLPRFAIVTPASIVAATAFPVAVPLTVEVAIVIPEATAPMGTIAPAETSRARFGVTYPA